MLFRNNFTEQELLAYLEAPSDQSEQPHPHIAYQKAIAERDRLIIRPQSDARKISEFWPAANDPQPVAAQGFEADAKEATPLVLPTHPSNASHNTLPKPSSSPVTRLHVPANQNLKSWRSLTPEAKEALCLDHMEAAGAFAFRLTFSLQQETKLRRAAASGADVLQSIADAISFQFRRRFKIVPSFGFCLEEAPRTNRLHIHGVYLFDRELPAEAIREAFCHGGGKMKGQAGSTQFWHHPVSDARRYFGYSRKAEASVIRRLGLDGVTFINDRMRRLGRAAYEAARSEVVTQRNPVPAGKASSGDMIVPTEDRETLPADLDALEPNTPALTQEGTLQRRKPFQTQHSRRAGKMRLRPRMSQSAPASTVIFTATHFRFFPELRYPGDKSP